MEENKKEYQPKINWVLVIGVAIVLIFVVDKLEDYLFDNDK